MAARRRGILTNGSAVILTEQHQSCQRGESIRAIRRQFNFQTAENNPATQCARVLLKFFAPFAKRGRRECRMLDAPAASYAVGRVEHTSVVTTGSPRSPGIPCAMALRLTPWSPRCTGLVSHRRQRNLRSANLTPASGCQDHTASPSASVLHVQQHSRVHRIPPHVCDVGQRPSSEQDGALKSLIWG
jgi:hypothetical protein